MSRCLFYRFIKFLYFLEKMASGIFYCWCTHIKASKAIIRKIVAAGALLLGGLKCQLQYQWRQLFLLMFDIVQMVLIKSGIKREYLSNSYCVLPEKSRWAGCKHHVTDGGADARRLNFRWRGLDAIVLFSVESMPTSAVITSLSVSELVRKYSI